MNADVDGGAHHQPRGVDDRDRVVGAIGDDDGCPVRRNPSQPGTSANVKRNHNRAPVKIENRNIVRPGIRDVSAAPIGRDINKEGTSVNANGGDDFVLLRINHADVRRTAVDNVNFVALRIGCNSGRVVSDLQSSHWPKTTQVDDRNCIALAVRDVSIFAVKRAVAGESTLVKVVPSCGEDQRDEDGDEEKFSQNQ